MKQQRKKHSLHVEEEKKNEEFKKDTAISLSKVIFHQVKYFKILSM
jgi:hypothetical protein